MIIRRLLVANRGEIAVRVLRTCRQLGIETVLAASDADLESTAARLADSTVCIGAARPGASYLNVGAVVDAAVRTGCEAIHPGYGFLSENAAFARACRSSNIVFVGPTEEQLAAVGDKLEARRHAIGAALPVIPGGLATSVAEAAEVAGRIGWPVLIKAVAGGGGRGMKHVREAAELPQALELATAEAYSAFGDSRVYLERFVASGRHVEVQVLGDGDNVIHLGDRDCSIQRRYQKLIEEAPAPDLPPQLRTAMHEAAVRFAKRLSYRGAGTVEFLVDRVREEFYFLEMNARIQVEHPVTELVTGLDLVAEQLAVAQGQRLRIGQDGVRIDGHAIECRINAEDSERDFRPSPGTVTGAVFAAGPGIRVDTHIESGSRVPPFYDSLLAKVIAHAGTRADCLRKLRTAVATCRIEGVQTNLILHSRILASSEFATGGVDTAFLTRFLANPPARAPGGGASG